MPTFASRSVLVIGASPTIDGQNDVDRSPRFAAAMLREAVTWCVANDLDLEIRVGVASGPAVGGVIGRQRLLPGLWGGTVNTAARMESSGIPGRNQVASSTRALLDPAVELAAPQVDVKGLGPMTTYLVVA